MRQTLSRGVFAAAAAATGILSLYGTPALADSFAGGGAEDSPGVLSGNNVQAPVHVPVNACGNTVTVAGALNEAADNTCVNSDSHDGHGGGAHAVGGTEGSPGVGSGNNVQAPVHVPVNACGNSVNGLAAANGAYDNTCANVSGHDAHDAAHDDGKAADRSGGSSYAEASGSSYTDTGSSYTGSGDGAHAVGAAQGSPGVLSGNVIQAPVDLSLNACGNSVNLVGLFNGASGNTCVNETGHEKEKEKEQEKEKDKEKPEPPVKVKTPPTPAEEPPAMEEPGNPPHMAQTGTDGMMAASAAGAVLITGGAMLYRRGRLARR
ncbi:MULTISPECIES: chaplin [unclassified Streptomyces]|uniref:chaplin n=1 Tax=unclassified Streptomyces TaxID=2593676 RepID=UPI001F0C614B|nr:MULTISPECIES: chaplin [unclassified Streptomyces]